jgi:hypothetical protein
VSRITSAIVRIARIDISPECFTEVLLLFMSGTLTMFACYEVWTCDATNPATLWIVTVLMALSFVFNRANRAVARRRIERQRVTDTPPDDNARRLAFELAWCRRLLDVQSDQDSLLAHQLRDRIESLEREAKW